MRSSSVFYLIREGIKNFWLNRLMAFASVGVLTTCLLLLGVAVLLGENVNAMLGYIEQQSDIVVFLKDDAAAEQIDEIQTAFHNNENVKEIEYISKQDAFSETQEVWGEDAILLQGLEEDNPFPASFRIKLKDLGKMSAFLKVVDQFDTVVDSVIAPNDVASTILNLRKTVSAFGIAMIAALVLVSLVIIFNTVRATVFARRMEIGIMKHVGATDGFIRLPFFVEGLIIGLLAAGIAYLIIWFAYRNLTGLLQTNASAFLKGLYSSIVPFDAMSARLLISYLVGGCATGALGSLLSIRKHLKV